MRTPEELVLTLCKWVKLHEARGEKSCINLGGKRYSPVCFQFVDWRFNNPTPQFVMEFTSYFKDRILIIDEVVCPECRKELDKEINRLIIEEHGIPPKEE